MMAKEVAEEGKKFVPIREAARILGVKQNTVRRWSDRGLIPHVRQPSGHRVYNPVELSRVRRTLSLSTKLAITVCMRRRDAHDILAFATHGCLIDDPKGVLVHRHYAMTETQSMGKLVEMITSSKYDRIFVRSLVDWMTVDQSSVLSDLCVKHAVALILCNLPLDSKPHPIE